MTYTAKLTRHPEATLWVHVTGEAAHELEPGEEVAFGLVAKGEPERDCLRVLESDLCIARAERDNAVRMAREVTDDLHAALAERDEVVDRICAAVTYDSAHYPLDVLMIGKLPVAVIVYGPEFVHRVCHEIRKAAEG